MSTIQGIFQNTICQGIREKYESVHQDPKTLLGNPTVGDKALLRHVIKTTMEESDVKNRLKAIEAVVVTHQTLRVIQGHTIGSESQ